MTRAVTDSGVYRYELNGEPQDIIEHWRSETQPDGGLLINSTRIVPGLELQVEAVAVQGEVSRCELRWLAPTQPALIAQYHFEDGGLVVSRTDGDASKVRRQLAIDMIHPAPLLSPLLRVFAGPLITRLLKDGGRGSVVVPFIGDPTAREELLLPRISERSARVLESQSELTLAGARFTCRCCEYQGDQYGPGTRFWLGEDDLLLRYRWEQSPQQHWNVWLDRGDELTRASIL